jgi:hypothetical protein
LLIASCQKFSYFGQAHTVMPTRAWPPTADATGSDQLSDRAVAHAERGFCLSNRKQWIIEERALVFKLRCDDTGKR